MRRLANEHGVGILYTGHSVNTLRECVFLGTYFYTYEGLRDLFQRRPGGADNGDGGRIGFGLTSSIGVPLAGGISGAWSWFVSFPLDCVKAGVQSQSLLGGVERHKLTAMDVLRELYRTKGVSGLYAGVTPSIVRAFIVSGTRFSAYEFAVWILRETRGER